VAQGVGGFPAQITFDGTYLWTANENNGSNGSISRIALGSYTVGNFTTGFIAPTGILYDGAFLWVADGGDNRLKKVNPANGQVVQMVDVGNGPAYLVFDGTNIWVPNFFSHSVTVVRAATGQVLAQLVDNGLNRPICAAFDGERVLVTNNINPTGISLWKAADLTPLGALAFPDGSSLFGACSDGLNFWITLTGSDQLVRF
jgi:DNA-binding beta-propeller fold protein YncE